MAIIVIMLAVVAIQAGAPNVLSDAAVSTSTATTHRFEVISSSPAAQSFAFDRSGVSNRFLTPNGDGRNDNVIFSFANPRDSEVRGRILDLRGNLVADMAAHPSLDPRFTRVWDGRFNGAAAAPGIYVYRLESEGKAYTGTVVVVR